MYKVSLVISGLVTSAMLAVIIFVYRRKQKRGAENGAQPLHSN